VNVAEIDLSPSIVIDVELTVPERSPDQLSNTQPESGIASTSTTVPSRYVLPEAGVTTPLPTTLDVRVYSTSVSALNVAIIAYDSSLPSCERVDSTVPIVSNVASAIFKKGLPLVSVTSSIIVKPLVQDRDDPTELPESEVNIAIANSSACDVAAVVPVLIVSTLVLRYASFSAETSNTSVVASPEYSPIQTEPSSSAVQLQEIVISPPTATLYAIAPEDTPPSPFSINVKPDGREIVPDALSIATPVTNKLPAVAATSNETLIS